MTDPKPSFQVEAKPSSGYARTRAGEEDTSGLLREDVEQPEARGSAYEDDRNLVPVMLEDFLEKKGYMDKLRPYIGPSGQLKNTLVRQLIGEFLGTMLFQLFGGAAPSDNAGPANGFALACLIYAFANVSGAHLNPAVSFALMLTGHQQWWRSLSYMCVQVLGAIFGSLIYAALIPGLRIGKGHYDASTHHTGIGSFSGHNAPGCFGPGDGIHQGGVFGWEMMMTYLLVMTVYACAVAKPGHGSLAPLAIGLSLYAAALTGGKYTGASLNPARTTGPAVVFACNVGFSFLYIFAEFFGAACAAGTSTFLYGRYMPPARLNSMTT